MAVTDEDAREASATPGRKPRDMSTDLQDPKQPAPDEGPVPKDKPKSPLSITQVVAGALAAMTAAALGSRLSVAGTVVGAALASVVAAVASAIYSASLRRTTQGVSAVLVKVRPGTTSTGGPGGTATSDPAVTSTAVADEAADGWVLPTSPNAPSPPPAPVASTPARARIGWKKVAVAAVLMFVVAALALTGLELVTGRALSGGSGTTVGRVADPATRPASTPSRSASPSPSATRSDSPTARPSATASSAPSSQPTPTPSTSATPMPPATPTPTTEPSATPSAAGGPSGAATPGS